LDTTQLAFFQIESEIAKPSTLWTIYSILKITLSIKDNENIFKFHQLVAILKLQNENYKSKAKAKSKTASMERLLLLTN
jgi:hypothetical protein